jgi:hypothetical protein
MFKSPLFWILSVLVSAGCALVAFRYFPVAFPLVTLDLQMDRQMALEQARELAEKHQWGPVDYREAAAFNLDSHVQNFVELEAGGTDAFRKMLAEGIYSPYNWRVRHFKEGLTLETSIRFTPSGALYGFSQRLPEDEPGASIPREEAQQLAESAAHDEWQIDWRRYDLVEASQEIRPGGRTDHSFVYQRRDARIGEGEYRLRLVVGGDKLTTLSHFVKVPEAFSRRYQEMRSANDTIGAVSGVATVILYIVGGCFIGLFYLLRHHWLIWRQPILWGFSISGLQVLAALNQWPLYWMGYDTALSTKSFVLGQFAQLLVSFLGLGALLSLSFMVAEGLTRRAFGHHIRLWKTWSKSVASTPAVAGRTVAGYLLVAVLFAYEVGLYFVSSRMLGWWSPSTALFDPDILATYFPWLTSIAVSLQAGFLEECLFRAVPIAGAALIGQRLGHRRAWIIGAFILQALIFGAGHANYPAQPAYARVVELIIPSIVFGLIYLYFGLLTAIVLHFTFDVAWIAMPLFVSTAPGIWVNQVMVVFLTLVPLLIIAGGRLKAKRWERLDEDAFNRSWQAAVVPARAEEPIVAKARPLLPRMTRGVVLGAGVLSLGLWIGLSDFHSNVPPLQIGREDAMTKADQTIADRGINLGDSWHKLAAVRGGIDGGDRFVWQEGGEEIYQSLLGTYLELPNWWVRFARFEGDVAERVEEYGVSIGPKGDVLRFRHQVPEARYSDSLSEEQARDMVLQVIQKQYGLMENQIEEVSARPSSLPNREDWRFTFADRLNYPLDDGEARITVVLAGKEVADAYRWIHVPEKWQRRERDKATLAQIVRIFGWLMVSALLMSGVVGGIIDWSRKRFAVRVFVGWFLLLAGLRIAELANSWLAILSRFSTAQPLEFQVLTEIGWGIVSLLVTAAAPAMVLGFLHGWQHPGAGIGRPQMILLGLAAGAVAACGVALANTLAPTPSPDWPDTTAAGAYLPLLSVALSPVTRFIRTAILFLFLFVALDQCSRGWSHRRTVTSFLAVLFGLALAGLATGDDLGYWLLAGVATGLFLLAGYIFVMRFELALVPTAVGFMVILGVLRNGFHQAHPTALPGAVVAAVLVAALSIFWTSRLIAPPISPQGHLQRHL